MNRLTKLSTTVMAILLISFTLVSNGEAAGKVVLYGVSSGFGTGEQGSGGTAPGTGPGQFSQFHIIDIDTGVATEISRDIGFGGSISALAIDRNGVAFSAVRGRGPNTLGNSVFESLLITIEPFNGVGGPVEINPAGTMIENVGIGPMGIEFGPPDSEGQGPGDGDFDQVRQSSSECV